MHFTALPIICLVLGTLAAPIEMAQRDTRVVERSIQRLVGSLKDLSRAVVDLQKSPGGQSSVRLEVEIERTGRVVTRALSDGASDMRKGPKVEAFEANLLIENIESLRNTMTTTVDTWIAAKPVIVRAGGRQAVLNILIEQEIAGDGFADAMLSKMPFTATAIGNIYRMVSREVLKKAIVAYQ